MSPGRGTATNSGLSVRKVGAECIQWPTGTWRGASSGSGSADHVSRVAPHGLVAADQRQLLAAGLGDEQAVTDWDRRRYFERI